MYKKGMFLILLLLSFVLAACNGNDDSEIEEHTTHNPTPEEILSDDKDADIFVESDVVYTNAEDIEWVNEEELTAGKEVGKINKQTDDSEEFENFTATKLPIGAKVYEPQEGARGGLIYIVKTGNEELRYLGLVEG